ncbi:hypothetical protein [Bosea sp. 2RAB26]|uniref:hypothetical protein n=2 Tax=Pseudomonadota TaxID=1224 RepID=UPI003F9381BA
MFSLASLRHLPDLEKLEDAGLLSKDRLLAEAVSIGVGDEGEGEAELTTSPLMTRTGRLEVILRSEPRSFAVDECDAITRNLRELDRRRGSIARLLHQRVRPCEDRDDLSHGPTPHPQHLISSARWPGLHGWRDAP